MSARSSSTAGGGSLLPSHLVPARRRARPQTGHKVGLLESMLNRTVLTVQRATHLDILKLGDRYVSSSEPIPVTAQPIGMDVDGLLAQGQAKFDRDLRVAREQLRRELTAEKERALSEQKEEFERHLDQVCALRDKAEDMAKRDLRRACELEKQAALRQQRDSMETQQREELARARADERQLARQAASQERAESVLRALEQAEVDFKRREQQAVERTRQECRRQFNEELVGIRKRQREEVACWMTKYKNLYKNFEQLMDTSREVTGDFRSIQADYKRFLDYSDGHFHSDYMMKLRHTLPNSATPSFASDAAADGRRSLTARASPPVATISVGDFPPVSPVPNRQKVAVQIQKRHEQTGESDRSESPPSPPMMINSARSPRSAGRLRLTHAEVYVDEDDVF